MQRGRCYHGNTPGFEHYFDRLGVRFDDFSDIAKIRIEHLGLKQST